MRRVVSCRRQKACQARAGTLVATWEGMNMNRINRLCLFTHTPARSRRAADLLAHFGRKSGNRAMLELSSAFVELAHAQRYAIIGAGAYARMHAEMHMYFCRRAVRLAEGGV